MMNDSWSLTIKRMYLSNKVGDIMAPWVCIPFRMNYILERNFGGMLCMCWLRFPPSLTSSFVVLGLVVLVGVGVVSSQIEADHLTLFEPIVNVFPYYWWSSLNLVMANKTT
jgi:hypothetical protein